MTRRVIEAWIRRQPAGEIPWTPLDKPLSECTVALISSSGIAQVDDEPPPIAKLIKRKPWLYLKFLAGKIPE